MYLKRKLLMWINQTYLLNLHKQTDNEIEKLRPFAEENQVPIVDKLSLDMIKQ